MCRSTPQGQSRGPIRSQTIRTSEVIGWSHRNHTESAVDDTFLPASRFMCSIQRAKPAVAKVSRPSSRRVRFADCKRCWEQSTAHGAHADVLAPRDLFEPRIEVRRQADAELLEGRFRAGFARGIAIVRHLLGVLRNRSSEGSAKTKRARLRPR